MSRLEYEILPERERYRDFCDFIDFYLCTIVREECTRIIDYLRGFEYILFLSVGDVCPCEDNSEQHQDERSQSKKKSIHSNSHLSEQWWKLRYSKKEDEKWYSEGEDTTP